MELPYVGCYEGMDFMRAVSRPRIKITGVAPGD
jgi:hypothetical protein